MYQIASVVKSTFEKGSNEPGVKYVTVWVGNWFGRCSLKFYVKFASNDLAIMILSKLMESKAQQILNFKVQSYIFN